MNESNDEIDETDNESESGSGVSMYETHLEGKIQRYIVIPTEITLLLLLGQAHVANFTSSAQ